MKVLLVAIPTKKLYRPVVPLGLIYIMDCLDKYGYQNELIDLNYYSNEKDALITCISEYKPDVVGISVRNIAESSSLNHCYDDITALVNIAKPYSVVILGGAGFSIFADEIIRLTKADYGIKGEGEKAFISILNNLEHNYKTKQAVDGRLSFPTSDISKAFIRYWDKYGKFILLNNTDIPIQRIRGCSNSCIYCSYPQICNNKLFFRDSVKVTDEIGYIIKHTNYNHLYFVDSVFNMELDKTKDFLKLLRSRRINIRWKCCINPSEFDIELIELMKETGCTSCEVGVDSMSNSILKLMNKNYDKQKALNLLRELEKVKLPYSISLILGGLGETAETLTDTIDTVEGLNPTSIYAFLGVRIYPNTPLQSKINRKKHDLLYATNNSYYVSQFAIDKLKEIIRYKASVWNFTGADLKG